MLIDINVKPSQIRDHLVLPYCSFIKKGVFTDSPGNSVVYCSQWFPFVEIAKACFPFIPIEEIKVGINYIVIDGPMSQDEEMHVHISMIIGIVVEGRGILIYEKEGKELRDVVETGDMVFVPRNTLHCFEGDPIVKYSLVEFGPKVDYQKHHKDILG